MKARDIKQLEKWGSEDKVISKMMKTDMFQPSLSLVEYYSPSGANWAYAVGVCVIGRKTYQLATRFGTVVGGREIHFRTYKLSDIKNR